MEEIYVKYIDAPEVNYLFGEGYKLIKSGKIDAFMKEDLNSLHTGIKNILCNCYIFHVKTAQGEYYLFKSIEKDMAFLSRVPREEVFSGLSSLHREFLNNIGEVIYFWGFSKGDGPFSNLAFMFLNTNTKGLGDLYQSYEEQCNVYSKEVNSFVDELIIFAEETEGCLLLYDHQENIYKYAFENIYSYLTLVENYPPKTLYRINNIKTLSDWVDKFSELII